MDEQYDDHIWLVVHNAAWAIESIHRPDPHTLIFSLWRGSDPFLEWLVIECTNMDWEGYCAVSVAILEDRYQCQLHH